MFDYSAATMVRLRAAKTLILRYNGSEENAAIKLMKGFTVLYSVSKEGGQTKIKTGAGATVATNDVK